MNFALRVPKDMKIVLTERSFNTIKMNADKMHEVLSSFPDFANEKSMVKHYLVEDRGHIMHYLPKFHCELNLIEHVWAHAKQYMYTSSLQIFHCKSTKDGASCTRLSHYGKHSKSLQKNKTIWNRCTLTIVAPTQGVKLI